MMSSALLITIHLAASDIGAHTFVVNRYYTGADTQRRDALQMDMDNGACPRSVTDRTNIMGKQGVDRVYNDDREGALQCGHGLGAELEKCDLRHEAKYGENRRHRHECAQMSHTVDLKSIVRGEEDMDSMDCG
jgi:hypothetical protein